MDFLPGNDSSEWHILGGEHSNTYQQVTLQEPMGWSGLSLDCYKSACSKNSGPIALKWNSDETLPMNCDVELTTDILIYDSCGKKIAQIPGKEWQYARTCAMGWTSTEKLFLLFQDGNYIIFSRKGELLCSQSIFVEKLVDAVIIANCTEDGFVAFSKNNNVIYVDCSGTTPVLYEYPKMPVVSGNYVECSCVIEAHHANSSYPEFIAVCLDQEIFYITQNEISKIVVSGHIQGQIIALSPSASNDYIALFTSEGYLAVFDRKFTTQIMEHNLGARVKPREFGWCGDDSVALYWRTVGILLFNSYADWMKFTYDKEDTVFFITECDSLRVYSSLKHEIIRRVPDSILRVYMDDLSCGAALRKAHADFMSHRGDVELPSNNTEEEREYLREGVLDCLDAAESELSTLCQEELLRSARFGKCFLDGEEEGGEKGETEEGEGEEDGATKDGEGGIIYEDPYNERGEEGGDREVSEDRRVSPAEPSNAFAADHGMQDDKTMGLPSIVSRFRDVTHTLRVLNALRDPSIAMFLTSHQFYNLGVQNVLRRLLYRHHYYLALKICDYLGLPPDFVLVDWASQRIYNQGDVADEVIRDQIRENLRKYAMISYKKIADVAYQAGRTHLATLLLEFEPRPIDRIPLLLQMEEYQLALRTATNSNDSDIMMMVALSLYKKYNAEDPSSAKILDLLRHFPRVFNSWLFYLKQADPNRLLEVMQSLLRYEEVFDLLVVNAHKSLDLQQRKIALNQMKDVFQTVVHAGRKDMQFYLTSIQDEVALIDYKLKLIHSLKEQDCTNMTVTECIRYAILHNKLDLADSMAKNFKVPDARLWRIKIKALVQAGMYDELNVLSNKRSPIGYSPFVDACAEQKNFHEAAIYLPKMKNEGERMRVAMKWRMYEHAFPCAVKLRDRDVLMEILNGTRNEQLKNDVVLAIGTIDGNK